MKTNFITFAAAVALVAALGSCADDREALSAGEGRVLLSTTVNTDVKVQSRAETTAELAENCMVWISKVDKGLVRRYETLADVPADGVPLTSGSYVAEAWTGDSVPASWDSRWFKGYQPFEVEAGQTTRVDVVCKVANVVASVSYSDDVKAILSDYTMTVGHNRGSLTFEGDTDAKGYFMMPSTDKNLEWTLTGKLFDGSTYTRTGVIENAAPATWYKINVKYTYDDSELGGGYITIEVDDTEIVNEDEIVISVAPDISGYGFDIAEPLYAEKGKVGRRSLFVRATSPMTSIVVECEGLSGLLGISGDDFDVIKMESQVAQAVTAGGVTILSEFEDVEAGKMYKISFEEAFTSRLEDGEHVFTITATDEKGKRSTATFKIIVSDVAVVTYEAVTTDIWATKATVTGAVVKDEATGVKFVYRRSGDADWTEVAYSQSGKTLTAYIEDLAPATTYEYAVICDQLPTVVSPMTFTTEAATQLPNSSFEKYSTGSDKAIVFYASGEDMFWDSGNHGSVTMRETQVTTPSTDYVAAGSYSLKLESQFVGLGLIGKFAAGNLFVGQFLGTENTTYGILGWGRPWTTRPKALKGYIKYTPGIVNYSETDKIKEGATDQGIIYIALLDDSKMSYGSYSGWPQIVATKDTDNYLFNSNGANVIAYGEKVFTEATDGNVMVEFEIPLTYSRTDIIPSNIIVTCSASRYGDYYSGGPSVMYIDNFELVY